MQHPRPLRWRRDQGQSTGRQGCRRHRCQHCASQPLLRGPFLEPLWLVESPRVAPRRRACKTSRNWTRENQAAPTLRVEAGQVPCRKCGLGARLGTGQLGCSQLSCSCCAAVLLAQLGVRPNNERHDLGHGQAHLSVQSHHLVALPNIVGGQPNPPRGLLRAGVEGSHLVLTLRLRVVTRWVSYCQSVIERGFSPFRPVSEVVNAINGNSSRCAHGAVPDKTRHRLICLSDCPVSEHDVHAAPPVALAMTQVPVCQHQFADTQPEMNETNSAAASALPFMLHPQSPWRWRRGHA